MRHPALLLIAIAACEHETQLPPAAVEVASVTMPEMSAELVLPSSASSSQDAPPPEPQAGEGDDLTTTRDHNGRIRRTPSLDELPVPPSERPDEYREWLLGRSALERQQIGAYCRAHPEDYQLVCGGIGPLHIPYPPYPRLPRVGVGGTRIPTGHASLFASAEAWRGSLTSAQLRYVERKCSDNNDGIGHSSDLCGDNTPLVIAFDRQPIEFTTGGRFAFSPGAPVATDWPTAVTPWIVLDRNGDGAIDSGAELFGSDTRLASGRTASNGFVALAELDANRDGRIDASDPAFAALQLWADHDGDQRSAPAELSSLAATVDSMMLDHAVELRCDARGNCEGERASMTWRDGSGTSRAGSVVDVYLPQR